jgi:hypothetical protein
MNDLDPNKCWNCGSSEPCDKPATNWWFAARNPGWYEVCCDDHNASKVKAIYPPELTREQALDYTECSREEFLYMWAVMPVQHSPSLVNAPNESRYGLVWQKRAMGRRNEGGA